MVMPSFLSLRCCGSGKNHPVHPAAPNSDNSIILVLFQKGFEQHIDAPLFLLQLEVI
jgi:hypothetical protein